jgi:Mg/Co/Ni transporter MgtE
MRQFALWSFVAGMLVKSDVVFNLGASLGIGLINGFISGAITGLLIGVIHSWYPHLISPAAMFMALAVVICAAFIISLFWKKEE